MKNLVVVTGGTKGLGLELVKLFSKKYEVLVIARTKREEFPNVYYEYGNLEDEKFVKKVYAKFAKTHRIVYLINNAATGRFGAPETNDLEKINTVLGGGWLDLFSIPLMQSHY